MTQICKTIIFYKEIPHLSPNLDLGKFISIWFYFHSLKEKNGCWASSETCQDLHRGRSLNKDVAFTHLPGVAPALLDITSNGKWWNSSGTLCTSSNLDKTKLTRLLAIIFCFPLASKSFLYLILFISFL